MTPKGVCPPVKEVSVAPLPVLLLLLALPPPARPRENWGADTQSKSRAPLRERGKDFPQKEARLQVGYVLKDLKASPETMGDVVSSHLDEARRGMITGEVEPEVLSET